MPEGVDRVEGKWLPDDVEAVPKARRVRDNAGCVDYERPTHGRTIGRNLSESDIFNIGE